MNNSKRVVDFLRKDSENNLLEIVCRYRFSDDELNDLPFWVDNKFIKFFDCKIVETDAGIFFAMNELGGYFYEEALTIKLKTFPSNDIIEYIKKDVDNILNNSTNFYSFTIFIGSWVKSLDVEEILCDVFLLKNK